MQESQGVINERVDKNWKHSLSSLKIAVFLTSVQRCSVVSCIKMTRHDGGAKPTSDCLSSCAIHYNLSVGDDSQWNDCGCFSALKISISTLQQSQISSQFRIRSSEVSEEREKERERERERERLNSSAHIAMQFLVNAAKAVPFVSYLG